LVLLASPELMRGAEASQTPRLPANFLAIPLGCGSERSSGGSEQSSGRSEYSSCGSEDLGSASEHSSSRSEDLSSASEHSSSRSEGLGSGSQQFRSVRQIHISLFSSVHVGKRKADNAPETDKGANPDGFPARYSGSDACFGDATIWSIKPLCVGVGIFLGSRRAALSESRGTIRTPQHGPRR